MRATLLSTVLLVGCAAIAEAQSGTGLGAAVPRVEAGDRLGIVDGAGATTWGRLVRITPADVEIVDASGRARAFAAADVRRIERRGDSVRNGLLIGAVIGGALGGAIAGSADLMGNVGGLGTFMRGAAVLGGVGGGVGLALDAVHVGRSTIYDAALPSARGDRGWGRPRGVQVAMRWSSGRRIAR